MDWQRCGMMRCAREQGTSPALDSILFVLGEVGACEGIGSTFLELILPDGADKHTVDDIEGVTSQRELPTLKRERER